MKTIFYGILILVVIGIAGFLYRNATQQGGMTVRTSACTLEAKICPDGTSVGRSGPDCAFAPCPPGNIEIPSSGVAFALPAGYSGVTNVAPDAATIGMYADAATSSAVASPGTIIVRDFAIPAGGSASPVIIENSVLDASSTPPTTMNAYTPKVIGNYTFESIILGRSDGTVASAYFLPRSADVLEFEVIETGVDDWSDPGLNVDDLPEHQALLKLLTTLQSTDPALQAAPAAPSAPAATSAS